ncbi:MAG TPA: Na+/H+ antiporter subunit E [Xanthobacteraceae bacterium]|jgi:multicomponent K+:H+ antiporter subunit E|nr:Na+/H+ antiporter subunit E [Xanthobacteraceae bacterium]
MKRLLPFPIVSTGLFALWLVLNQSISPGHILLGILAGFAGGWALAALDPPKTHPRRVFVFFRLAAAVIADIVRSNIEVARIILGRQRRNRHSGFVEIPLELRNAYGLAMLACIITSTPGTLWVNFDDKSGVLTIHVLDLVDRAEWVRTIKGRYEGRLLEIFP